ncbi:hypothetical protein ACIGBH_40735 [Streptomyces sp. NPDC085929]|uniref:hypothetical protein n=1 Tax=Streptomyces sp. NPDC085929 TaxID=3365739 RepID=UPI0037D4602B
MRAAVSLSIARMGGESASCPPASAPRRKHAVMHASSDQSGVARRRFLKGVLATTAGSVLVPALARPAQAAGTLPVVGQTVNLSVSVLGAVMTTELQPGEHTLDFSGVRLVKVLEGGTDFVQLQTLTFQLEGAHPLFGKIIMRLPDIDVSPLSTLRVSSGELTETWNENSQISFDRSGDVEGPFSFAMEKPLQATATMLDWPPQRTNPDGSPTEGVLYSTVQMPTFTSDGQRIDFTAFPLRLGHLPS